MPDPRTDAQVARRLEIERGRLPDLDEYRAVASAAADLDDDLAGPRRSPLRLVPREE